MQEQSALIITCVATGEEVQVGPLGPVGSPMARIWENRLKSSQGARYSLAAAQHEDTDPGVTGRVAVWREPLPTVHVGDIPDTAHDLVDLMDAWDERAATGAGIVDLRTLTVCKHGPDKARELWYEAGDIYDALYYDGDADEYRKPNLAEAERDRIAGLVNAELAAAAGDDSQPEAFHAAGSAGHIAYDTVMQALRQRAEQRPGGPAREVMTALIEIFGVIHLLDGLADGPDSRIRVPFDDNIKRAAVRIAETRALLTDMIVAGSANIEAALDRANLITVSIDDLVREGVPGETITKLCDRAGRRR